LSRVSPCHQWSVRIYIRAPLSPSSSHRHSLSSTVMYLLPESPPSLPLVLPELFTKAHPDDFTYRRSLRDCCRFKLHVASATLGIPGLLRFAKGPQGPNRGMLPRRKPRHIPSPSIEDAAGMTELEKLLPWLYVSLSQPDDVTLVDGIVQKPFHSLASCFSHIICISSGKHAGHSEESIDDSTGLRTLQLVVPNPSSEPTKNMAGKTSLSKDQLFLARDFLSLALPHPTRCFTGHRVRRDASVRVLVTSTCDRPADVISIVACYMAYASGKSVETVLRYIREGDFLETWIDVLSSDGIRAVEATARTEY
jgi:hypothetical protein